MCLYNIVHCINIHPITWTLTTSMKLWILHKETIKIACLFLFLCFSANYEWLTLQELRERVLRGKYRIPFYMSTDCENLLKKLLVVSPLKRFTLEVRFTKHCCYKLEYLLHKKVSWIVKFMGLTDSLCSWDDNEFNKCKKNIL